MKTFSLKLVYILIFFITVPFKSSICQWVTGNVDTLTHDDATDYAFSPNSIFIDDQNTLHVVWQKRELFPDGWRIYYAKKFVNGSWTNPIRISDSLYTSVYPSIVVASKLHKVFISYVKAYSNFNAQIVLAIGNENSTWNSIDITNDSLQNRNPTIDIDKEEDVHLAWLGMDSLSNDKIKYSNSKSGNWETYSLDDNYSGDNYYAVPSLSISPNGNANILYLSVISGVSRIVHARNDYKRVPNWFYELLPKSVKGSGILKISKKGKLNYVFNYTEGFQYPFKVYYTSKAGPLSNWSSPELIGGFDGHCTSVEIDDDEKVHLTLDSLELAFKTGMTYYATNKSGTWQLSVVSTTSNIFFTSFKLDKNGLGHIIASSNEFPIPSELLYLKSENNLISIHGNFSHSIDDYALFQNYPNPFNPFTIIGFHVPSSQYVRINIYNCVGNNIKTITSKMFNGGSHTVRFNSENLSSGIYFYKIVTPNFSSTKKMIILK